MSDKKRKTNQMLQAQAAMKQTNEDERSTLEGKGCQCFGGCFLGSRAIVEEEQLMEVTAKASTGTDGAIFNAEDHMW